MKIVLVILKLLCQGRRRDDPPQIFFVIAPQSDKTPKTDRNIKSFLREVNVTDSTK